MTPSSPTVPAPPAPPAGRPPNPPTPPTPPNPPNPPTTPPGPSNPWQPPRPIPSRPAPGPPGGTVLAALAAVGVLAAVVAWDPPGVGWTVLGWTALGVGTTFVRRRRVSRRGATRADAVLRGALAVLAGALWLVPSVSTSEWLVALCLAGSVGVATVAVTDARTWRALLMTPFDAVAGAVLALPWLAAGVSRLQRPEAGLSGRVAPWAKALAVTVPAVGLVGALLAAGDAAFARALDQVVPQVETESLPVRVFAAGFAVALLVTLLRAGLRTSRTTDARRPAGRRPLPEWAVPLAAVDLLLVAFFALQAWVLFGGHEVVEAAGVTYAERAREGFGQLCAVTVVTLALVGWAAARCDASRARDRLVRDVLGGGLVVLSLGLVASALRRMWLYEDAYGPSVRRYVVVVVELGVGVVFLLVLAARRSDVARHLPRLVVVVAALTLLVLGLTRPDAVVADRAVDRWERTGAIDTYYLSGLSRDAAPAVARLPDDLRAEVTAGWRQARDRPWFAANLAAHRAGRLGTP